MDPRIKAWDDEWDGTLRLVTDIEIIVDIADFVIPGLDPGIHA
ncbi:hypothetical protein [Chelativorans sp. YIM 93263]|nr:hypothetical protein [Chelativorans sp. YIM 93263]